MKHGSLSSKIYMDLPLPQKWVQGGSRLPSWGARGSSRCTFGLATSHPTGAAAEFQVEVQRVKARFMHEDRKKTKLVKFMISDVCDLNCPHTPVR